MIQINNYKITFNGEADINDLISKLSPSSITVLTDENTVKYCLPLLFEECETSLNVITIPSGEQHKSIDTCNHIWGKMIEYKMDRHSLLINLGGGVIGDMGGFCAATYMRGIRFVQIPTTLLSQVDSSVGGKLGVDFNLYKNMVGLFADPVEVIINTKYLDTLPYRQLSSGFAEIIKHGLIVDKRLWNSLFKYETITELSLLPIIEKSVAIKAKVVKKDPYEKGLRKILNFGHTIGHAIESYSLTTDNPLLHGEAISIGMICESYISSEKGLLSKEEYDVIKENITKISGKKSKSIPNIESIYDIVLRDKKNDSGNIKMTLLHSIGKASYDHHVSRQEINQSLEDYKK